MLQGKLSLQSAVYHRPTDQRMTIYRRLLKRCRPIMNISVLKISLSSVQWCLCIWK